VAAHLEELAVVDHMADQGPGVVAASAVGGDQVQQLLGPAVRRVAGLDPERSPPDELAVRGREVYLRLPNGVARTRITNAWLDTELGTTSTLRNWRTVLALVGMATEE